MNQQPRQPRLVLLNAARLAGAVALLASGTTGAQTTTRASARATDAMTELAIRCDTCHTCEKPSARTTCLRLCSRKDVDRIAAAFATKHGPRVVLLDDLEDRYLPVPFDHQGHADMSRMGRGCVLCHHYTPEGLEHPACKTCHEVTSGAGDITKPGLKGAYHRQCMGCHREWSGQTQCGACHHAKTGVAQKTGAQVTPTPDDLVGRMHPPMPEPDVEVYDTKREGYPDTQVLFRHKEHIHRFDLRCAECHHEDGCNRCHQDGKKHAQQVRTLDEHHKPCLDCHRDASCEACHYEKGKPPPPPFDHAQTGWPLNRYHIGKSCRSCHAKVPFRKTVERTCNTCHEAWTQANFDHAVVGLALDANHVEIECEQCHLERKFEDKPVCTECHDKEFTYPARKPGKRPDKP